MEKLRRAQDVGWHILTRLFPFHYAAWMTAYTSISEPVNAPTEQAEKQLLRQWTKSTTYQLSNVEIIGTIMSATVVGAFSWPGLSNTSPVAYTMIKSTWYPSLILAIAAVAVGVQQSVFLMCVGCFSNGHILLRKLLSFEDASGKRPPYRDQVVIWQLAVGLLEVSIYAWLGGFVVFVWDSTRMARKSQDASDQVVAGLCLLAFIAVVMLYAYSMLRLWFSVWRCKDLLGFKTRGAHCDADSTLPSDPSNESAESSCSLEPKV